MTHIIIIGGGIAGVATAIELAKNHPKSEISIIESNNGLLLGSSNRTPCRLGLGLHYNDAETAKKYLRNTLDFLNLFPDQDFRLGGSSTGNDYLRRGLYHIVRTKNDLSSEEKASGNAIYSTFPVENILSLYQQLSNAYDQICRSDPQLKIDGNSNLYKSRTLTSRNINPSLVNTDLVVHSIETLEGVLDWPKFQKFLVEHLKTFPNIKIYCNHEATAIKATSPEEACIDSETEYKVFVTDKTNGQQKIFPATAVCNASWQNIEKLGKTLDIPYTPEEAPRTLRLKMMIEIRLPEPGEIKLIPDGAEVPKLTKLESQVDFNVLPTPSEFEPCSLEKYNTLPIDEQKLLARQQIALNNALKALLTSHSMFFCFGPHTSFTNRGDGSAFLTYEPETNVDFTQDLEIPASWEAKLDPNLNFNDLSEEDQQRALRIIQGASHYIPILGWLAKFSNQLGIIRNACYGIVRTGGFLQREDLDKPSAPHHKRSDDGVRFPKPGYAEIPATKLLYGFEAAKKAAAEIGAFLQSKQASIYLPSENSGRTLFSRSSTPTRPCVSPEFKRGASPCSPTEVGGASTLPAFFAIENKDSMAFMASSFREGSYRPSP